jgi:thermitase
LWFSTPATTPAIPTIASGIYDATDRGARIISISIGGSGSSSALQAAVNYAWSKGTVVFAAAMNNSTSKPYYPAACDKVVAVSATNSADGPSSFSNYGNWIDVSAPGESILTTSRGGGYGYWSGTSFASPIAAGVAALVLTLRPSLGAADLVNVIGVNADDLGMTGSDPSFGRGRVNAYKAVLAANTLPLDPIAPLVTLRRPDPGATVSGIVAVEGAATDNVGLARVELLVDGAVTSSSESASFSFQWNSGSVVDGVHTISVKADDFSGNSSVATASVAVSNPVVADNISPTIEITSPRYGSFLTGTAPITVSASDNIAVTQVNIYIDGILHYSGGTAPYAFKWNTKKTAVGLHTITATAWDAASNHAIASPVVVTRR